jgi:hypothetical protein
LTDDHVFDVPSTTAQNLIQGGPSIRAEMKSVSHLDRVRRSLPPTFGIRAGTIADDDLDTWVAAEPLGEHVCSAIVEQVDWAVCFEIEEQRAIAALLAAQSYAVDTQHARATLKLVILKRMQDAQERVRADGHTDLVREASATFAASLQGKGREQLSGPVCSTSVASQFTIEAFCKDLPWAGWHIAEPAPAVHAHPHRFATPREIKRVPIVATVLPSTQFTTPPTRHGYPRRFDDQDQIAVGFDDD